MFLKHIKKEKRGNIMSIEVEGELLKKRIENNKKHLKDIIENVEENGKNSKDIFEEQESIKKSVVELKKRKK